METSLIYSDRRCGDVAGVFPLLERGAAVVTRRGAICRLKDSQLHPLLEPWVGNAVPRGAGRLCPSRTH